MICTNLDKILVWIVLSSFKFVVFCDVLLTYVSTPACVITFLLLCRPIYTKVKENHEEIIIKKEDSRGGAGGLFNKKGEIRKIKEIQERKRGERKEKQEWISFD